MNSDTSFLHPDALLRFAIRLDGVIIAISGIVILLAVEPFARTLAVPDTNLYRIGAANVAYLLIAFALAALRPVGIGGVLAVAANLASAIALGADLVDRTTPVTSGGVALKIAALVYCLAVGGLQLAGFLRLPRGRRFRGFPTRVASELTAR